MTGDELKDVRRQLAGIKPCLPPGATPEMLERMAHYMLGRMIPDPGTKHRLKQQIPNPLK